MIDCGNIHAIPAILPFAAQRISSFDIDMPSPCCLIDKLATEVGIVNASIASADPQSLKILTWPVVTRTLCALRSVDFFSRSIDTKSLFYSLSEISRPNGAPAMSFSFLIVSSVSNTIVTL